MIENWVDVDGFEGLYKVSNLGRIRGTKILSPTDNGKGYKFVFLSKKGKEYRHYVHRIVAKAFIANPDSKPCVNHRNGIRADNRACNLEWVTRSENELHKYAELGFVQKTAKPVAQVDGETVIETYTSIHEASRATGCRTKEIKLCCCGKIKQTHGLHWRFVKQQIGATDGV